MSQQPVVEVARHAGLLHGQHAHGVLHALEGGALPHEVHLPPRGYVTRGRRALHFPQLQRYLLRPQPASPDDHARAVPGRHAEIGRRVPDPQLIPGGHPNVCVVTREGEVGQRLLVQRRLPPYGYVLAGLPLLGLLVLVRLHLHQRPKYVLVLVGVLVVQRHRVGFLHLDGSFQVLHASIGARLPRLLKPRDLTGRQTPGTQPLVVGRVCHEPGHELAVGDEGLP
mmetsp:Transcript_611/g.1768  ORF Transcript_611/g.1768 Transcript_611/m.1768 type:complete len:225 (+) Transcript_611:4176-4850(+)